MKRKKLYFMLTSLLSILLLVAGCGNTTSAGSEKEKTTSSEVDYPKKTIKIIVSYAAGGGSDVQARTLSEAVKKYLPKDVDVIVENKPGGAGTIGLSALAQAEPDGYTLGFASISNLAIQTNYEKTPYRIDDFEPIIQFTSVPSLFLVKDDAPWQTYEELIDYIKQNPGKFTFGSNGAGGITHLNIEAVNQALGTEMKIAHFDGSTPTMTALLGGHVMGVALQTYDAIPQIEAGKVRPLAIFGTKKTEDFKDLPLLTDQGLDTGIDSFIGLVAPKGTPKEIITIVHDAFKQAMEDKEVIEKFHTLNTDLSYAGPEEFKKIIEDSHQLSGKIMEKSGLK